ncbi:hypothetical protein KAM622c_23120 [Klebsiella quasipneumoniae subsp. quasipneumoniae]|nr:hypothetical protein KAM622c_23120 [Klebsiella quasipneumoniae subsp. quasipneumoniae]
MHVIIQQSSNALKHFQKGIELGEKTDQIGLQAGDLDVGTQRVKGGSGKGDVINSAYFIDDEAGMRMWKA